VAASDLVTLADARAFLQKQTPDTAQDGLVQSVITRASAAARRFTEREFAPASNGLMRTFECEITQEAYLDLAPFDLRSVSLIQIDTDISAITLSTDEYRLAPITAPDGVYTGVRLAPLSLAVGRVMWRNRQVQITGNWGFASVPEDVKHWTLVTVAEWLRKDAAAFSTVFNLTEDKVDRPEMLPRAVQAGLARWKRAAF
jgi:hypothetical protein